MSNEEKAPHHGHSSETVSTPLERGFPVKLESRSPILESRRLPVIRDRAAADSRSVSPP